MNVNHAKFQKEVSYWSNFKGITLRGLATGLGAFLSSLSTSRRCSRNRSSGSSPCFADEDLFAKSSNYVVDDTG